MHHLFDLSRRSCLDLAQKLGIIYPHFIDEEAEAQTEVIHLLKATQLVRRRFEQRSG